jgi:hypothetical protein
MRRMAMILVALVVRTIIGGLGARSVTRMLILKVAEGECMRAALLLHPLQFITVNRTNEGTAWGGRLVS